MNRVQYGEWLTENATALTAVVPIVFTPDKFDIAEDQHEAFLKGITFGLGFAAKMAGSRNADFDKMARNAHIALHEVTRGS